MNKTLYRFAGAFIALLGLAYLGHNLFVRASAVAQPPATPHAAAANVAPSPQAGVQVAANARAYPVYPDRETDSALGLSYTSFSGDFVDGVTMTPLPPNAAGRTALRIKGHQGKTLSFSLNDTRCASAVHLVVNSIDNKQPIAVHELTSASPKFDMQFDKQWLPNMLVELRMDDKASNNYFCGVTVNWSA